MNCSFSGKREGGRQGSGLLVWTPAGAGVQTSSPKPWAHSCSLYTRNNKLGIIAVTILRFCRWLSFVAGNMVKLEERLEGGTWARDSAEGLAEGLARGTRGSGAVHTKLLYRWRIFGPQRREHRASGK